jgi:tetratricopeptide (TPR) repeat protein
LRADPGALENRLGLATVALKLGEPAAALAQYDRLLRERPAYVDAMLGRSWALLQLGRLDEARATLRQARRRGADERIVSSQFRLLADLEAGRLSRDNH